MSASVLRVGPRQGQRQFFIAPLLVAVGYFAVARLGFALRNEDVGRECTTVAGTCVVETMGLVKISGNVVTHVSVCGGPTSCLEPSSAYSSAE